MRQPLPRGKVLAFLLFTYCSAAQTASAIDTECTGIRYTAKGMPTADITFRPASPNTVTFFAIGDWGTGGKEPKQVAELIQQELRQVEQAPRRTIPFVVGLGDAIYGFKARSQQWDDVEKMQQILQDTFGSVFGSLRYRTTSVPFYVIPGNHDHRYEVRFLETLAEQMYPGTDGSPAWRFFPTHHPEVADSNDRDEFEALRKHSLSRISYPKAIDVGSELLRIVAIDSYTFIRLYDASHRKKYRRRYWKRLAELFEESDAPWRIIISHHPVSSTGPHGIRRSALGRFFRGLLRDSREDISNPAYHAFSKDMKAFFRKHQIQLLLSGHEHSLQFLDLGRESYQVISGSASQLSEVRHCSDLIWGKSATGFLRMDLTASELWLEYIFQEEDGVKATQAYRLVK